FFCLLTDVYQNLGYNFAEFLQEDQLSSEEIEDIVDFKGLEYLDQALEEGKGVIIYTAHLGNWELMGTALSRRGYSVDAIAR
ncbi:lysophospholipid acyltransferase family protein, partial [Salmonella enterica subsp. enterica serovar Enteritidis]|uniref:lysophospholipid acyltransferase family protein n=1 Tax=Salmonella enterica TaxID=28901 RepID=UPI0039EAD278